MRTLLGRLFQRTSDESITASFTIESHGESNVPPDVEKSVVDWLGLSLYQAGFEKGCAHLFWLGHESKPGLTHTLVKLDRRDDPIFAYRTGDRLPTPPNRFYWRMMPEHPSTRVYQLEVQDDDA